MKKPVYRERVIHAGQTIEIIDTYPTRFGDSMRRENRKTGKGTPEAQKKYNLELAKRQLTRLINENFVPDDLWVSLAYERDNRPKTKEDAKKLLNKFIRRLRVLYKSHGKELKAIKRTAYGARGAIHHHIVIPQGVKTREITKLWNEVSGASKKARAPFYVPLYPEGEYSSLASYIVDQIDIEDETLNARKWTATRNIKKPYEEPPKDIPKIKWDEPITPIEGYCIEAGSIRAGTNEVTGRPYLFYRMVKIENECTCRDDNGKLLKGAAAAEHIMKENARWIREHWAEISPEGEVKFYGDG